jgi:hypothetical protein
LDGKYYFHLQGEAQAMEAISVYFLHLASCFAYSSTVEKEAVDSAENLVIFYGTT